MKPFGYPGYDDDSQYPDDDDRDDPAPVYRCAAGCGYPVASPGQYCGECACEDDGDIW